MQGVSMMDPRNLEIGDEVRLVNDDGAFTGRLTEADPVVGLTFMNTDGTEYIMAFADIQNYDFYPKGATIARVNAIPQTVLKEDKPKEQEPTDLEDPNIPILIESIEFFELDDELIIETAKKKYVGKVGSLVHKKGILSELDMDLTEGSEKGTVYTFSSSLLEVCVISALEETAIKIAERMELSKLPEDQKREVDQNEVDFFVLYEQYESLPPVESKSASQLQEKMELCAGTDKDLLDALDHITAQRVLRIEEYITETNAAPLPAED